MSRIAVLVSGSGTNLQALLDATATHDYPAEIAVVLANRPKAYGLERARAAGVPAEFLGHRPFNTREAFDAAMVDVLRRYDVEWVALAGFMRLVTPVFLSAFPDRVLNIHPALLPAFPGLDAQGQALAGGARIAGATVHFVDAGTDSGPIILQGAVPVHADDDIERLKGRILRVEHQIYPRALRWAVEGRLRIEGRRVHIEGGAPGWVFCDDAADLSTR